MSNETTGNQPTTTTTTTGAETGTETKVIGTGTETTGTETVTTGTETVTTGTETGTKGEETGTKGNNPDMFLNLGTEGSEEGSEGSEEENNGAENYFGYDIGKYSDRINLEDAEVKTFINGELEKLHKTGASQEVIDYIIEKELSNNEVPKENLNETLSLEEKRNYKPIHNFVDKVITNEADNKHIKEMLGSSSAFVRILNGFYKNSIGSTGTLNIGKGQQTNIKTVPYLKVKEELETNIKNKTLTPEKISDLKSKVDNPERLETLLKAMGK